MSRPKKITDCQLDIPPSKRDCVLAAAQQIFLEMGYAAASMDAVAARANVSKATIYAYFDNKRALFEHVIQGRCQRVFSVADLPQHYSDARATLRQLAITLQDVILSPEAVAINRVVIAEAPRLPEVGEAFYAAGPVPGLAKVTDIFTDLTRLGLLSVPDDEAPLVAELFLNMLKGDAHTRVMLGLPPSRADHARLVDVVIDLIMARYGRPM